MKSLLKVLLSIVLPTLFLAHQFFRNTPLQENLSGQSSTAGSIRFYLPQLYGLPSIQAPALKWQNGGCYSTWCETGWYSSPAVAEIDGDGTPEVLAGSYSLVALHGENGSLEWRAESEQRIWPGIAVADLTGDGRLEIIVGRGEDQVTVYNRAGNPLWTRHPFGYGEVRSLAVADLENDGQFEILAGRAGEGATNQVNVYEPDGSIRTGWPARHDGEPGNGWGMYNQNLAVEDLNGDGYKEVIAPTDTHYITGLDRYGGQLPVSSQFDTIQNLPVGPKVWSQVGVHVDAWVDLRGYANCAVEHRPNFADSAPVLADINGDGQREIIVVGNVYNCGTNPYTSLYQAPFIFNADRSRWNSGGFDWTAIPIPDSKSSPLSEDYTVIENAMPDPAIADLDGDGYQEILYPSYDGRLHAYWLDKTEHGSWPFRVYNPAEGYLSFASEPVVVDLDDNGKAEVIFASWTQIGSNHTGNLYVLDDSGKPLYIVKLPDALDATWNGAMAAPTLANIDGDPDLEVVVLTANSGVVAYDLPGSANARVLWGTGRGNFLRGGSK